MHWEVFRISNHSRHTITDTCQLVRAASQLGVTVHHFIPENDYTADPCALKRSPCLLKKKDGPLIICQPSVLNELSEPSSRVNFSNTFSPEKRCEPPMTSEEFQVFSLVFADTQTGGSFSDQQDDGVASWWYYLFTAEPPMHLAYPKGLCRADFEFRPKLMKMFALAESEYALISFTWRLTDHVRT